MVQFSLYIAIGIIFVLLAIIFWLLFRGRRAVVDQFEEMEGHEFEYYCADLLKKNEITKIGGGRYTTYVWNGEKEI